jgi:hypothetical protein
MLGYTMKNFVKIQTLFLLTFAISTLHSMKRVQKDHCVQEQTDQTNDHIVIPEPIRLNFIENTRPINSIQTSESRFTHHPDSLFHDLQEQCSIISHQEPQQITVFTLDGGDNFILISEKQAAEKKEFACYFFGCHFKTDSKKSLMIHLKTHAGEKPYKCTYPFCDKAFSDNKSLKLHTRKHNEKKYKCSYGCGYSTTNAFYLERHMKKHEDSMFKCPYCNRSYIRKINLIKHIKNKHPDKGIDNAP